MRATGNFVPLLFLTVSPVLAEGNPFMAVRDRDQWAIEQVMGHKVPEASWPAQGSNTQTPPRKKKAQAPPAAPVFQTRTLNFGTETDQAKVSVRLTDLGTSFLLDVTSDQTIQGWLLKRQSTREAFLKGGVSDNPYQCRIKVERPYLKDFGLTLYVTQDSDPAFIQLY